jgi:hypothetical protein
MVKTLICRLQESEGGRQTPPMGPSHSTIARFSTDDTGQALPLPRAPLPRSAYSS